VWTGESCQTNEDGTSQQALDGDASSVKSDDVEVDDDDDGADDDDIDDDDDIGIIFTVPPTVSIREGKYSLDRDKNHKNHCPQCTERAH